ncbi:phage head spike fiber domain-containing protein [Bordetella petrii]|uniref:Uncharacterized protein n=1 Tax=Bordetella petrii (strain ATCC BAA-461 / DSM 12804 / CCUG 43448 / CIP 107267 / Se-1111R) TaxID=340100 RepID=A9I954_BORPD|nr:hypothetical protein [Bordetella petrii]CAP41330.1 hypothetical protein predicted by Glimmer/Critica [Bordetella petrii]
MADELIYKVEAGRPLEDEEVDGNIRFLDQKAGAAQAAAVAAGTAASNAATAANDALDGLAGHKIGGDHDGRYLRRDIADAAPLLGDIPQAGVVGLPAALDALRTAIRQALYGSGPYPSLDERFVGATRLSPAWTFLRTTTATLHGPDRLMRTAAVNEPRFDHDSVTGAALGLRLEPRATNFVTFSDDFTNAIWTALNQVPGVRGSDGWTRLTEDAATGQRRLYRNVAVTAGREFVMSLSVKPDIGRQALVLYPNVGGNGCLVRFDLANQVTEVVPVGTATGSAWLDRDEDGFRLSVQVTFAEDVSAMQFGIYFGPTGGQGNATYAGDGSSGIYVRRAQLTAGSARNSFIPTAGTAVSRAEDVATVDGAEFSSWFNPIEGTFLIEAANLGDGISDSTILVIDDGGTGQANQISIRTSSAGQTWRLTPRADGANIFDAGLGTVPTGTVCGVAFSYGPSGWLVSFNGDAAIVVAGAVPGGLSRLRLGVRGSGAVSHMLTHRLSYWPISRAAAELQELTS